MLNTLFASLMALQSVAAPVPKDKPTPAVECEIAADPKTTGEKFELVITLKNNTDQEIELKSQLPFGVLVFVDVVIEDADGKRVSEKFHYAMIASPYREAKLVGAVAAKGELKFNMPAFSSLPKEAQKPGKYNCKVQFKYDKYDATSNPIAIEFP